MAFVKARLHLDTCFDGEIISILYEDTAANEPLARSILTLGHKILSETTDTRYKKTNPATQHTARRLDSATLQLKHIRIQVKK
ncbi:MAG: hypothetical protein COB37_06440 [Kordiimonadales bacterium]|nr:MAG: hypothetical protein COB37_06440 [Kordiimonadales bacterium]